MKTRQTGSRSKSPAHGAPAQTIAEEASTRGFWIAAALITAAGLALRLLGARGDLWVDEIWSLDFARDAQWPWDIFSMRSDNNHLLNTLALYVVRDQPSMFVARLHSVIAGTASVLLAGVFALRWGRPAAVFAMTLMAASYVMVHYGSEARGYAMLVCFFLAALILLDSGLDRPTWLKAIVFWLCCALAALAHSLFVPGYIAMLVWSLVKVRDSGSSGRDRARVQLMFHAVPIIVLAALYFTFMRQLHVAGASAPPLWETLRDIASFTVGAPRGMVWGTTALGTVVFVLSAGTAILWRTRRDEAVLFLTGILIAPMLVVLITSPGFLFARYFIIPIALVQLLAGYVLGRMWGWGTIGRAIALITLGAMLAGHGLYVRELLTYGRGSYFAALHFIEQHTNEPWMQIGGDHDLRQATIVRFYAPMLATDKQVTYVPTKQIADVAPEWVLLHRWSGQPITDQSLTFDFKHVYALRATYPASPLGGWTTLVYQRQDRTLPPAQ